MGLATVTLLYPPSLIYTFLLLHFSFSFAGQLSEYIAAMQALSSIFNGENCDLVLIVDADSGFYRLNRKVMLINMLC